MNLPRLSANRPVGVGMLYLCVAVLGLVAMRQLAVDLMPEVDMPRISITTTYEGVAPEEMESLITRPIEQVLSTVTGLDQLNSMSAEGMSSIQAQFDWGIDLNEVVNDIREQLDFVRGNLPEDASAPTLFKFNLSDMPVVSSAFRATATPARSATWRNRRSAGGSSACRESPRSRFRAVASGRSRFSSPPTGWRRSASRRIIRIIMLLDEA